VSVSEKCSRDGSTVTVDEGGSDFPKLKGKYLNKQLDGTNKSRGEWWHEREERFPGFSGKAPGFGAKTLFGGAV